MIRRGRAVRYTGGQVFYDDSLHSDIHGNYEALKTVLAEIDRLGVERIYCAGDVVAIIRRSTSAAGIARAGDSLRDGQSRLVCCRRRLLPALAQRERLPRISAQDHRAGPCRMASDLSRSREIGEIRWCMAAGPTRLMNI